MLPQRTASHTQAGGGGIMLWWKFPWASLGPAVEVEQTLNATENLYIITYQLHPYTASVFPNRNGMLQKDNAPYHKAPIVLRWLQEHIGEFQLMSWPPN